MAEKPELIIFNQYKIGGVQSFYYNILKYAPANNFDINWVFIDNPDDNDSKPEKDFGLTRETIVKLEPQEIKYRVAKKLNKVVSKKRGVIVTNFDEELIFLHLYRRRQKTVVFVCHDIWYVHRALRYEFLIDLFVAHNKSFYQELIDKLPHRKDDIYYLPYGVSIPSIKRQENVASPLKLVIAARLQVSKGVYDLPVIDELLKAKGILVEWTIIGNGPEKQKLQEDTLLRGNFKFLTLPDNNAVIQELSKNDIFILPSRIEGLPVSMLEAMSVGCVPVIAAFNEGIREIVTKEIGYVLEIGDNDGFAKAIEDLHSDRNNLEAKSREARKKIEEYYDIKKRSKDYFDFFNKHLGYKKRFVFKFPNYGGYANNPWIPRPIRFIIKAVKGSGN